MNNSSLAAQTASATPLFPSVSLDIISSIMRNLTAANEGLSRLLVSGPRVQLPVARAT